MPLLAYSIHLSLYLLLLIPSFAPPLLPALIPFLLPLRYRATNAAETLCTYLTWYIPLLSLNGILEAFHSATASPAQVSTQGWIMLFASSAFAVSLGLVSRLPQISRESALVYASCGAMAVRIAYAFFHARNYAAANPKQEPIVEIEKPKTPNTKTSRPAKTSKPPIPVSTDHLGFSLVPRWDVLGASLASGTILRALAAQGRWKETLKGWGELVGLGGLLGVVVLVVIWDSERGRFVDVRKGLSKVD